MAVKKTMTLVLVAALLAFAHGFVSARFRIFPHGAIRWAVKTAAGEKKTAAGDDKASRDDVRDLISLPYLGASIPREKIGKSGVTVHKPDKAFPGLNLYLSGHRPSAILVDMEGNEVHRWQRDFEDVFGEVETDHGKERSKNYWRRAWLFENGDILCIHRSFGVLKLDKSSNILWSRRMRAHHDLYVDRDGVIYVLTRGERDIPFETHLKRGIDKLSVIDDYIAVLTPEGEPIKEVSILDCLMNSDYRSVFYNLMQNDWVEIFHTNTLFRLEGGHEGRVPMFRDGLFMVSCWAPSMIGLIDLEKESFTWALQGMWYHQHDPRIINNGNVLLLDNMGHRGRSKVIEFDPLTQEIVWAYRNSAETPLYTHLLGACQRLPNGNTAIVESESGRVIEVTPAGETVWEFVNPRTADDGKVPHIFDCQRFRPEELGCAKGPKTECFAK